MSDTIIKIEHVSKEYRLGAIGGGTLRGDLQSFFARLRGKEDPNARIGTSSPSGNERFLALDDVSFSVKKGERVGIIGHNGAGKSTLLKLLSRVTAPTEGTICYNGRIASMLEVGTGFHPELTGRENIYLNGAILGMSKAEITEKFDDIVRFAEMEKFVDTPVKRYSSGMYVKLAFAVAAHLDSEILVMDEVLAVGDMKFQQKCLGKMDDVSKNEGKTVLYVSHNMNTVRQLCTRCIVLDHGKVIFDGDVEEAIAIYSANTKEVSLVNDCSGEHKGFETDRKIHMDTVSFTNVSSPVFSGNDKICLQVDYTAREAIRSLAFRMTVFYGDKTVVGLATTKPCVNAVAGTNTATFTLAQDWLAPGKYIIRITAYSVNEFGATQLHDVVDNAAAFEKIADSDGNNHMTWNHSWWGYVMFPEVEVRHHE